MIAVQHLPENMLGRDFIVGDLHGRYDLLEQVLWQIEFDGTRDRLFSVGDMCDRGPYSMEVLRLLNEPWFFAVRGNHEEMLLEHFDTQLAHIEDFEYSLLSAVGGGDWILEELATGKPSAALKNAVENIRALPLVIAVVGKEQRYNIVHGELYAPHRSVQVYIHASTCLAWPFPSTSA